MFLKQKLTIKNLVIQHIVNVESRDACLTRNLFEDTNIKHCTKRLQSLRFVDTKPG